MTACNFHKFLTWLQFKLASMSPAAQQRSLAAVSLHLAGVLQISSDDSNFFAKNVQTLWILPVF